MNRCHFVLLALALCAIGAAPTSARTWRVEKVLPADFRAIQPALDAASPGDTIRIGYGRWTEKQHVTLPGWSWAIDVYAWVHDSDLTIIGAGPSSTVIGPLAANFQDFGPIGIVANNEVGALHISNLTVTNTYSGQQGDAGPVTIDSCRFQGNSMGLFYAGQRGLTVKNCEFWDGIDGLGIFCSYAGPSVLVEDCQFMNVNAGIDMGRTTNAVISRCTFEGGVGGIQYENGSTGGIFDCQVRNPENFCVGIITGSRVTMQRNVLIGGGINLELVTNSYVTGSENELRGGTYTTISIAKADLDFHGNHILNAGRSSVRLDVFLTYPNVTIDLTGNYWGTTDPAQLARWIYDYNDDQNVHAVVTFAPFAGGPIGVEQQTWGQVKTLYGR